jgi:hypothetical protein
MPGVCCESLPQLHRLLDRAAGGVGGWVAALPAYCVLDKAVAVRTQVTTLLTSDRTRRCRDIIATVRRIRLAAPCDSFTSNAILE